jgi:dihydrofolate reductase
LKRFRTLTEGKVVVMGRKTFESIGKPLPKRLNLIVSKTLEPSAGIWVARSVDEAIHQAADLGRQFNFGEEIMVIGGGQIYEQAMPVAHRLYLTRVAGEYEGDAFFPEYSENDWELSAQEDLPTHSFLTYDRR